MPTMALGKHLLGVVCFLGQVSNKQVGGWAYWSAGTNIPKAYSSYAVEIATFVDIATDVDLATYDAGSCRSIDM